MKLGKIELKSSKLPVFVRKINQNIHPWFFQRFCHRAKIWPHLFSGFFISVRFLCLLLRENETGSNTLFLSRDDRIKNNKQTFWRHAHVHERNLHDNCYHAAFVFAHRYLSFDQSESFQMLLERCDVSGQVMFFESDQDHRKIDFQTEWEERSVSRPIFDRFCSGKNYCVCLEV